MIRMGTVAPLWSEGKRRGFPLRFRESLVAIMTPDGAIRNRLGQPPSEDGDADDEGREEGHQGQHGNDVSIAHADSFLGISPLNPHTKTYIAHAMLGVRGDQSKSYLIHPPPQIFDP